jgi:hypothetical protein
VFLGLPFTNVCSTFSFGNLRLASKDTTFAIPIQFLHKAIWNNEIKTIFSEAKSLIETYIIIIGWSLAKCSFFVLIRNPS